MTAAQLAAVASLLADRSRAAICVALLDGRAWTVGELARQAGIAPSTASEHVARLVDGGLLASVQQGRHRYVRLADARTAQLIEDLAAYASLSPAAGWAAAGWAAAGWSAAGWSASGASSSGVPVSGVPVSGVPVSGVPVSGVPPGAPGALPPAPLPPPAGQRSLRSVSMAQALARGRTCYDHLAGRLGVRVTDALTDSGVLDQANGFALTGHGLAWLESALHLDVAALRASRRPLVRSCLDWTERRPHLGGAAGAAICDRFLAQGWITRIGTGRAVRVSPAGEVALRQLCGVDLADVL